MTSARRRRKAGPPREHLSQDEDDDETRASGIGRQEDRIERIHTAARDRAAGLSPSEALAALNALLDSAGRTTTPAATETLSRSGRSRLRRRITTAELRAIDRVFPEEASHIGNQVSTEQIEDLLLQLNALAPFSSASSMPLEQGLSPAVSVSAVRAQTTSDVWTEPILHRYLQRRLDGGYYQAKRRERWTRLVDRVFFFLFALAIAYLAVVCSLPFLPADQETVVSRALVNTARWTGLYPAVEWFAQIFVRS
mmetsp:Transcript_2740/g.8582  ORF Transcript_2740/g.8582 Transcript_2740/m.8582 type:complete len:253 (+) Transcript_2740:1963-2721(+)